MGDAPSEYDELVGFLSDSKLEVQKMAAEGVLSMTEDQDFLAYCHANPRKVAKPLLRLVESAEASAVAGKAAFKDAAEGSSSRQQKEKEVRKAAAETAEALAAGGAALQALVNLSGAPDVCDALVALSAPKRACEALRGGWLEGRADLAHWYAMLLANLSTKKAGQEALCADEKLVHFLLATYVANPRPPPRDGIDDPLECLGKVFQNLCALPEGRRVLGRPSGAAQLVGELRDRARRCDALGALLNLCIDSECHEAIIMSGFAHVAAAFIYPWEVVNAAGRERLPAELREELAASGAALTADASVRGLVAACLLGLCQSPDGRAYLRLSGYEEVLMAWDAEEQEADTKTSIRQSMEFLAIEEPEPQELTAATEGADGVGAVEGAPKAGTD